MYIYGIAEHLEYERKHIAYRRGVTDSYKAKHSIKGGLRMRMAAAIRAEWRGEKTSLEHHRRGSAASTAHGA